MLHTLHSQHEQVMSASQQLGDALVESRSLRSQPQEPRELSWLLLRGLGREQGHWFDFPARMSARLDAYVFCLDLPGFGEASHRSCPWSIEGIARDVGRRIAGHSGSLAVLALSLGAMVALALAKQRPEIQRLVLVNSSSRLSPPWQRLSARALPRLVLGALSNDPNERQRHYYQLTSNAGHAQTTAWAARAALLEQTRPFRSRAVLRQLCAATRFVPPRVSQPSLLLSSSADRLVSASCSQQLADFLGAAHAVHPSAGHELSLDAPEWVLDRVQEWFDSGRHFIPNR